MVLTTARGIDTYGVGGMATSAVIRAELHRDACMEIQYMHDSVRSKSIRKYAHWKKV